MPFRFSTPACQRIGRSHARLCANIPVLNIIEYISENLTEFDSSRSVKNYIKKLSIYCTQDLLSLCRSLWVQVQMRQMRSLSLWHENKRIIIKMRECVALPCVPISLLHMPFGHVLITTITRKTAQCRDEHGIPLYRIYLHILSSSKVHASVSTKLVCKDGVVCMSFHASDYGMC